MIKNVNKTLIMLFTSIYICTSIHLHFLLSILSYFIESILIDTFSPIRKYSAIESAQNINNIIAVSYITKIDEEIN